MLSTLATSACSSPAVCDGSERPSTPDALAGENILRYATVLNVATFAGRGGADPPTGVGSGIALTRSQILVSQHQIVEGHDTARVGRDAQFPFTVLRSGGHPGEGWSGLPERGADWAVLGIDGELPNVVPPRTDWQHQLRIGDVVWLAGRPVARERPSSASMAMLPAPLQIIACRVDRWQPDSTMSTLVMLEPCGDDRNLQGFSGGGAFVIGADGQSPVLIGVVSALVEGMQRGRPAHRVAISRPAR